MTVDERADLLERRLMLISKRKYLALIVALAAMVALNVSFTVAAGVGIQANHQRIADIQQSRVESCVHTYAGIREVFRPFFPPPKNRSHAQQKTLNKFNATIRRLEAKCPKQTRP